MDRTELGIEKYDNYVDPATKRNDLSRFMKPSCLPFTFHERVIVTAAV